MSRSVELTQGQKGTIFVALLLIGLMSLVFLVPLFVVHFKAAATGGSTWAWIGIQLVVAVFAVISSIAAAVGYHRLRRVQGAFDDDIARTFE